MKIGIDAHALGTRAGGNETYVRLLLRTLHEVAPETDILALVNRELHGRPNVAAGFPTHPLPTRSSWIRVPFVLPILAERLKLDLLMVQYNGPPVCRVPYVVAVHDMVQKRFPDVLPWVDRYRMRVLAAPTLRKARRVFCLTEAMRREAHELYNVPSEKIDVVPPALDPVFQPIRDEAELGAVRQECGLPERFILYTGALHPRKNLVRLAEAFGRLKDRGLPHRLVFTGKPVHYSPLKKKLEALNLGDRLIFTGYVRTEDLPRLMSAADAFGFVSLYEGFGIPSAEAMACGTPTLVSTDPALVEVSGGAALTCDPLDVDAIEEGLARLLTDNALRARLQQEGPERAKYYSAERMARAALAGFERALA